MKNDVKLLLEITVIKCLFPEKASWIKKKVWNFVFGQPSIVAIISIEFGITGKLVCFPF